MHTETDANTSRAAAVMRDSLVWDNHGCMAMRPMDESFLPQLERYRQAGVNIVALNVGFDVVPWENTVRMLAQFRHWVYVHPDDYLLVATVADIERVKATGKLGVFFNIEGGCALADQLSMVELYYDLGVRWMLLAYNRNNSLGGGCQDTDDPGLTAFGREVVDEMAGVGMVTCCTHTGHRTVMDIMGYAKNPVIFSHSNPRGLWAHPRNVTDEAIKACAATGGVVNLNGIGLFLGENDIRSETFVRHVDYLAELVGVKHIGVGLDYVFDQEEMKDFIFNNPQSYPPAFGYQSVEGVRYLPPEQIPEIAEELVRRGYSDDDLRAILGGNNLRVARQVWK